jgi:hypothetical protein
MASSVAPTGERRGLAVTQRRDAWWLGPLATALVLGGFGVYATYRAIANADYVVERPDSAHILSPFYSPLIVLPGMPAWLSPAFLILWAPGGFRLTCYYYRKAYYRAFFLDPPGCAVGEARGHGYRGETRLLLFQNLHRYFLYLALVFLVLLSWDVVWACLWPASGGGKSFGLSVGTLVLAGNVVCLSLYTFSCHSLRHLVGGSVDCFSCAALGQARLRLWQGATRLNARHALWAWISLFTVAFADFYVWMVASGRWTDVRLF